MRTTRTPSTASAEELTVGRSAYDSSFDPSSTTHVDCVGVTFNFPHSGRAVITSNAGFFTGVGGATGSCRLEVDDATTAIPHTTSFSAGESSSNTDSARLDGFGLTAATDVLGVGSHTFELSCNEITGNIGYGDELISAVMIGSG